MKNNQNFNVITFVLFLWSVLAGWFYYHHTKNLHFSIPVAFLGCFLIMPHLELIFIRSSQRFRGKIRRLPWWFAITLILFSAACLLGAGSFLRVGWYGDNAVNLPCFVITTSWLFTTVTMYFGRWRKYYLRPLPPAWNK